MNASPRDRAEYTNPVVRWIEYRLPVFSYLDEFVGTRYPAPRNLNYWWNFGSLAGLALVLQILTGIVLAMHYTPHVDFAFASVEHIMRNVNFGWLLRYAHSNGASLFFLVVYIHLFRGLYYGSYKTPRELLWMLGVVILLLMMATAFMGYVLPWGQMSFWAATVITNLFSAIPLFGEGIVTWLWGGFSVDNPTLNRFYSLHYVLPFVIVGVVMLHLLALHQHGSNNPLGIDKKSPKDTLPFHPYYTVKDLFGVAVFMLVLALLVFYAPNLLGHPDNYIPANPLQTPPHIVPEWYFLPFYAILRAITFDLLFIPAKLIGVILMFGSIIVLFFLPWLDTSPVRSARFRPVYKWFFWLLVADCVLLGYLGAHPPEGAYVLMAQLGTAYYFFFFLILLPLLGKLERPRPVAQEHQRTGARSRRMRNWMSRLRIVGAAALILAASALKVSAQIAGDAGADPREVAPRRPVRHLRSRRGAAGFSGLPRGVLRLSRPHLRRVPQSHGSRVQRRAGGGAGRRVYGDRRPERRGRDVRAAGAARGPDPAAVSESAGCPRRPTAGRCRPSCR